MKSFPWTKGLCSEILQSFLSSCIEWSTMQPEVWAQLGTLMHSTVLH